ncbi:MAG: D-alanine--D-alanine ligase [Clostridiales bacterium]|uniref:D-alanine--D-alanine ligase n=1 Tax=Candidatus Anaerobutyricum stercoripullorum TaxID=2838456 RepID=A0A9D1X3Y3_9FIRM|nr:D-alanine--D-alanine ligase [Clostridiales bacterium]HIX72112.1 D-alanine--D-alanine ligase [Candidatus Anaerobutyricum stercoripullorum]
MAEKNIVVIMGGRSSEHEVSLVSAATVVENINTEVYNVIMVGITKDGQWKLIESLDKVRDGSWVQGHTQAILSPETGKGELILMQKDRVDTVHVDVVFPVLHGMNGEDGTLQGLLELAQIPYVGCGVLASACSMDKFYTKIIVDAIGIRQAKFVGVRRGELTDMDEVVSRVEKELDYPVFVKPSKAGSSQGVSKAEDREGLVAALRLAAQHDSKILVEENIVGRELECAVLGGAEAKASGVGEILAADTFYSYEAKYNNEDSRTVVGPELPEGRTEEIRRDAEAIFKALDCYGLSRVDFFLTKDTEEVVFNEINTLPGFTAISMYPMLWEAEGVDKKELIQRLIDLAMVRYDG